MEHPNEISNWRVLAHTATTRWAALYKVEHTIIGKVVLMKLFHASIQIPAGYFEHLNSLPYHPHRQSLAGGIAEPNKKFAQGGTLSVEFSRERSVGVWVREQEISKNNERRSIEAGEAVDQVIETIKSFAQEAREKSACQRAHWRLSCFQRCYKMRQSKAPSRRAINDQRERLARRQRKEVSRGSSPC